MNNPTNCKECHKLAISNSLSILFPYLKMLLKKFGKKHNKKVLNFNIESLIRKYRLLDGKCEISGIVMEHIVNKKQQFDNIWNTAILYNSPTDPVVSDEFIYRFAPYKNDKIEKDFIKITTGPNAN